MCETKSLGTEQQNDPLCSPLRAAGPFYAFAGQCIVWAHSARSLQERAVYVQMALQSLSTGATLQTCAQFARSAGQTGFGKQGN
jgi:hypothetical protein